MQVLMVSIAFCQALHPFRNTPGLHRLYSAMAEFHLDQLNLYLGA